MPRSPIKFSIPKIGVGIIALKMTAVRGFTLLELLVVLSILGLISAVALPQLSSLSASIDFALNRENLERALSNLPYQALKNHEDYTLGQVNTPEQSQPSTTEPLSFVVSAADINEMKFVEGPLLVTPAPISFPKEWKLTVDKPIIYRSTGMCSGGDVDVRIGKSVFSYELKAPECLPVPK